MPSRFRVSPSPSWLVLCLALAACSSGSEPEQVPERGSEEPSSGSRQSELDKLRAIGYAEVSDETHAPEDVGVQHYEANRSSPGYNLYTNRFSCSVILMDARGREINRWERPEDRSWSNCQLMPDGDLIVIGQETSQPYIGVIDENRYLLRLSWEGEERWKVDVNAHHDFEVLEDGRIAVLSFRRNPDSGLGEGIELREDTVEILSRDGEVVETRSLYEVLRSNSEVLEVADVEPVEKPHAHYQDLIHANSVEFLRQPDGVAANAFYSSDHVLVSTRHQDVVVVFDWKSGELVWSWGRGELLGPHDATLLENGNVLIFDNGLGRGWSRVIELDPIEKKVVWQFKSEPKESFYTASRGSSQRLPNGNTLIAESDSSRAFEVTKKGRVVWFWLNPERNARGQTVTIVRMKRLPLEYVEAILEAR